MSEDIDDESELIKQLKKKFNNTQEKSVKVQILSLLPMSWSIKMNLRLPITWFERLKS